MYWHRLVKSGTEPERVDVLDSVGGQAVLTLQGLPGQPFRAPDCGEIRPNAQLAAFTTNTMFYLEGAKRQICGAVLIQALLTRQ